MTGKRSCSMMRRHSVTSNYPKRRPVLHSEFFRRMRLSSSYRLPVVVGTLLLAVSSWVPPAMAQSSVGTPSHSDSSGAGNTATFSPLPSPLRGGPWITGVNVWAGSAASVRTASHNESFDGALSMIGVQFTRSLFVAKGVHFSWMVEVVPLILATVEAPPNRMPTPTRNAESYFNSARFARYTERNVYGFGVAPFSAEAAKPLNRNIAALFSVTSGGAFFSAVVPYGKATQANFTVSPAAALEWRVSPTSALALGYTLHHLSNASFGESNPGMNSHVFFARVSRARFPSRTR